MAGRSEVVSNPNFIKWIRNSNCILPSGKFNILMDGQFGSTGKGLVAGYLGRYNRINIAVTNSSMNAGHTFYVDDVKYVTKHIPVSGIVNPNSQIYLCAGAIINPDFLLREIEEFGIENRLHIHPRAAVIELEDIEREQEKMKGIASTCSGCGSALMRKIERRAKLAKDNKKINFFISEIDLNECMDRGMKVLMEVPQGFDLSINSGLAYPYCTSREITVSAAMADAQVHPSYLGKITVVIRTYPIRVGNIIEEDKKIGDSGPFYPDSIEITWEELGINPEYTTNTNRIRRIATFSRQQYKKMLKSLKPDFLFLNFANYMQREELYKLIEELPEVTHIGMGKVVEKITHEPEFDRYKRIGRYRTGE